MAQWIDANGIFHNTDNLAYGDQGDQGMATEQQRQSVQQSGGIDYTRTAQPGQWDRSTGTTLATTWTPPALAAPPSQPTSPPVGQRTIADVTSSGGMAGGRANPDAQYMQQVLAGVDRGLLDTYYSEMAARNYAQRYGMSIEQARVAMQDPANAGPKRVALFQAVLADPNSNFYQNPNQATSNTTTNASGTGTGTATSTANNGENDLFRAAIEGARVRWELERREAEQRMTLARSADERSQAMLQVQQADQELRKLKFEQDKLDAARNTYSQLAQALLSTASGLRGPRNYASFLKYVSGGRGLLDQLYGSQGRPAFAAPTGQNGPMTIQDLLGQLGMTGTDAAAANTAAMGTEQLPQPFQINPAVWDSLGSMGQQLLLGMAEQSGYDPEEYVRQVNAARPEGTAARRTAYRYAP